MKRFCTAILCVVTFGCVIARADSIDDAEAKRRGVPVEQVVLERHEQQLQSLHAQIDALTEQNRKLMEEVEALKKRAAGDAAKPALPALAPPVAQTHPAAAKPFVPTDTFTARARKRLGDQSPLPAGRGPLVGGGPPRPNPSAVTNAAAKVDQDIAAYLKSHPDTPNDMAEAMYAGQVKPGMTEEQVKIYMDFNGIRDENLSYKTVATSPKGEGNPYQELDVEIRKDGIVQRVRERTNY